MPCALGGVLLVVVFVTNPELLALLSVVAVIGLDAFVLMLCWQLRDYFRAATIYLSAVLNLPRARRWLVKFMQRATGNSSH